VEHVACMAEIRNDCNIVFGKLEMKDLLGDQEVNRSTVLKYCLVAIFGIHGARVC
jgi:hypothetical protein